MAIVAMTDAVTNTTASSAEYNKVTANIRDLDARLGAVVSTSTAHARLTALEGTVNAGTGGVLDLATRLGVVESRTTDTATSPGGIGNQQLANRFGTGVGTTTNVLTGTATAQLTDIRSRVTTVEGTVNAAGTGNSALGTRVTALEASSGTAPFVLVTRATDQTLTTNVENAISWSSAPRNPNTMWAVGNPTRITVPSGQGGLYLVEGMAVFTVNASGFRTLHIRKNGAGLYYRVASGQGSSAIHTEVSFAYPIELAAGDYIEISAWQNTGGNLALLGANTGTEYNQPSFLVRKVA